jgi:hypothetical protein
MVQLSLKETLLLNPRLMRNSSHKQVSRCENTKAYTIKMTITK